MLATQPIQASLRAAYIQELQATLALTDHMSALPKLPLALLALNATFYLDQYLTTTAYHKALTAALEALAAERQTWRPQSTALPGCDELQALIAQAAPRKHLYRWLFDRALDTGRPTQFVVAQHACEIAEVVAESHLPAALRLGLLPVPEADWAAVAPVAAASGQAKALSIDDLSRALFRRRIAPRWFAEQLLVLHAANRARQLTGIAYTLPNALPQSAADAPTTPCVPKRISIAQPHDLAQRALALADPFAVMTVEAGLMEAEELRGAPQLLLLAALDRALGAQTADPRSRQ